ncbi:N-acetyltransferase family protein [Deinococcus sp. A31D244]|uniref:GNAT family N-acetyltransferase n=1 Tax=Deinococcus sp. A31D244 TaxID=3397675 RepID=UPI0039E14301
MLKPLRTNTLVCCSKENFVSSILPTDSLDLIDLFAQAKLAQAAPLICQWSETDVLYAHFQDALRKEVERVTSDDLAALFHQYAPVAGVETDEAYKNRVMVLPHLGTALVGIRFRSLDLSRPFVTVVAHTAPLPGTTGLVEAAAVLREAFQAFAPKHVQFFVPADVRLDETQLPGGTHWDVHVLAAPVAQLRHRAFPPHFDRVQLRVPDELETYPRYVQEFEALFEQHPQHRDFARIEAREDLAVYHQEGLVFEVEIDGAWAGLVAATRSAEQGLKGFVVVEMFLDGAHRGRGFGPAVGRHLIERLPMEPGDTLYGTIHHENRSARRSAELGGREDIGAFLWVNLIN